jgi:hypothetical protein
MSISGHIPQDHACWPCRRQAPKDPVVNAAEMNFMKPNKSQTNWNLFV